MNLMRQYLNATDKRSFIRHIRSRAIGFVAHKMVDFAERIMPSGHGRGRFERVNQRIIDENRRLDYDLVNLRYVVALRGMDPDKIVNEYLDKISGIKDASK